MIDIGGVEHDARIVSRAALAAGFRCDGPLIIEESCTTTVVLPGQAVEVDAFNNLLISKSPAAAQRDAPTIRGCNAA